MKQRIFVFQTMQAENQQQSKERRKLFQKNKQKKSIMFSNQTKTNWEKLQQIFFVFVLNFQFEHWVPYVDWRMLMLP